MKRIAQLLLAGLTLCAVSCSSLQETATTTTPDGVIKHNQTKLIAFGGKGLYKPGEMYAYGNEKSFGHAMTAATTVASVTAGAISTIQTTKATEATKQTAIAGQTSRHATTEATNATFIKAQQAQNQTALGMEAFDAVTPIKRR